MTSALADYRHYFMPARFYTIAVRGMHYGRYGAGGEDSRLIPLFLGYPEFVRGYGVDSFQAGECGSGASCPTYDRLVGSRMLVGNIEFRFPLLRPFGVTRSDVWAAACRSRVLPRRRRHVEQGQKPSFFNGGTREPVTSGGITLRTNLLGFADRANRLSRGRSTVPAAGGFGDFRSRLDSDAGCSMEGERWQRERARNRLAGLIHLPSGFIRLPSSICSGTIDALLRQ